MLADLATVPQALSGPPDPSNSTGPLRCGLFSAVGLWAPPPSSHSRARLRVPSVCVCGGEGCFLPQTGRGSGTHLAWSPMSPPSFFQRSPGLLLQPTFLRAEVSSPPSPSACHAAGPPRQPAQPRPHLPPPFPILEETRRPRDRREWENHCPGFSRPTSSRARNEP